MEQPNPHKQKFHSLIKPFVDHKCTTIIKNLNKTLKNVHEAFCTE